MADPSSVIHSLSEAVWKLKTLNDMLSQNREDLYWVTTNLIDDIEDLKTFLNKRPLELNSDNGEMLARLLQQLTIICLACETLVPSKNKGLIKSVTGWAKKLYNADTDKRKIRLLEGRIRNAHQRFMTMNLTLIASRMDRYERNNLHSFNLFTIDLSNTTEELKISLIRHSLHLLESALGRVTIVLSSNVTNEHHSNDPVYKRLSHRQLGLAPRRSEALLDILRVLKMLEDSDEASLPAQLKVGVKVLRAMKTLELNDESFKLAQVLHGVIQRSKIVDIQIYLEHLEHLALSLSLLSASQCSIGDIKGARHAAQEAVQTYRELVVSRPEEYNPSLADSLIGLSVFLLLEDREEDALELVQESVAIWRKLVTGNGQNLYNGRLASALSHLSFRFTFLDRHEEALSTAREVTEIYWKLMEENPPIVNDCRLTSSLHSLADLLDDRGREEENLIVVQEIVRVQRLLVERRPDACNPRLRLAIALHNLCVSFADVGKDSESLEAAQESVQLSRKLADDNPHKFNANLARLLNNLWVSLINIDNIEGALEAIEEVVQIRRGLVEVDPEKYAIALAEALSDLSYSLNENGRKGEALRMIQETVQIFRGVVEADPDEYISDFVDSLHALYDSLMDNDKKEDALEVVKEIVQINRKLVENDPGEYSSNLAQSLYILSQFAEGERKEEALEAIQESVRINRELAKSDSDEYPSLAESLRYSSFRLWDVGRKADALDAIQEAVRIFTKLTEIDPERHSFDLAKSLFDLSSCLGTDTSKTDAALKAVRRSLRTLRNMKKSNPEKLDLLRRLFFRLYCFHRHARRKNEALSAIMQTLRVIRKLAICSPDEYAYLLAGSLDELSNCLEGFGRDKDANYARAASMLITSDAEKGQVGNFNTVFSWLTELTASCQQSQIE